MEMDNALTKELESVCKNERYRFSSDMYPELGRVVRAFAAGDFDPSEVSMTMNYLPPDAKFRAIYLIRLSFFKSSNEKARSMLNAIFTQFKQTPYPTHPVAFFHMDRDTLTKSQDAAAIECGLVRGADLGKINQILEGRLA